MFAPALAGAASSTPSYLNHPEVRAFIDEMVAKYDFNSMELANLFAQAKREDSILRAMSRPAEAKPWYQYRPIFLTDTRIQGGVEFWDHNAELLRHAQEVYGVPPEIVTAIIGVETRYGGNTGSYRVLDALTTLAFDYPKRAAFFRSELQHFLLLTREESIDPLSVKGSYAGAMGQGQFISSSYRRYAVDFDGDSTRNLWDSTADAIGSVANYFHVHGWRPGEPVAVPASVSGDKFRALLELDLKPTRSIRRLEGYGVQATQPVNEDQLASLIDLEQADGHEYWLGLENFYVITRYNHSPLYAMAVYQLSQEIKAARNREVRSTARPEGFDW